MDTEVLKKILSTLKKENAMNAGGEISGATARDVIEKLDRIIPMYYTFFPVIWVAREDIERAGFDAMNMTNDEMRDFADKMADEIEESMDFYWDAIGRVGEWLELKKVNHEARR